MELNSKIQNIENIQLEDIESIVKQTAFNVSAISEQMGIVE